MKIKARAIANPLKKYYSLTKPGVLFGNVITAVAGFFLAVTSFGVWNPITFVALLIGMTLVIASACVLNNHLDRDIDAKMERTKTRATVTHTVSGTGTVIFSGVLGVIGILVLYFYTNLLTAGLALFGWLVYVILYGMWSKRRSPLGTLVGAVSGAIPIVAGYTAVTGFIDPAAVLVFLALFYWQIPEFYSIAIYRKDEYKHAGVPVITTVRDIAYVKQQILLFTIGFVIASLLLTLYGYTGFVYLIVMALLGIYWVLLAFKGLSLKKKEETDKWAHKMFHFSLYMLIIYSVAIAVGPLLP